MQTNPPDEPAQETPQYDHVATSITDDGVARTAIEQFMRAHSGIHKHSLRTGYCDVPVGWKPTKHNPSPRQRVKEAANSGQNKPQGVTIYKRVYVDRLPKRDQANPTVIRSRVRCGAFHRDLDIPK